MELEATHRENFVLDEVSDESPQVSSRKVSLLAAGNIQHPSIESVSLFLLDQELLIKCTCFDATRKLEFVDLVLTFFLIAESKSHYLHLMGEVVIAQHEFNGLDNSVISEGI